MEFIVYSSQTSKEILDKHNIVISPEAQVAEGVKMYSGVKVLGESAVCSGCQLHSNAEIVDSEIGANCKIFSGKINNCHIQSGAMIKPFVYMLNSDVGENCVVGNFSCINQSTIGLNCQVGSLCSINNVDAGNNLTVNSGACCEAENGSAINIGDNVIIGTNASLIKAVVISDDVQIEPNCVISKDIDVGQIATCNNKQVNKSVKR